jgi:hypothetical protein
MSKARDSIQEGQTVNNVRPWLCLGCVLAALFSICVITAAQAIDDNYDFIVGCQNSAVLYVRNNDILPGFFIWGAEVIESFTQPAHGSVVADRWDSYIGNGVPYCCALKYTFESNFVGTVTFDYTATEQIWPYRVMSTAKVTITISREAAGGGRPPKPVL